MRVVFSAPAELFANTHRYATRIHLNSGSCLPCFFPSLFQYWRDKALKAEELLAKSDPPQGGGSADMPLDSGGYRFRTGYSESGVDRPRRPFFASNKAPPTETVDGGWTRYVGIKTALL